MAGAVLWELQGQEDHHAEKKKNKCPLEVTFRDKNLDL